MLSVGAPSIDPEVAAIRVQKHWKGFAQRRRAKRERDDELMFIGMVGFTDLCCVLQLGMSNSTMQLWTGIPRKTQSKFHTLSLT